MLACVLLDDGDPALARRLFAVTPLLERVEGRSPSGDDDGGQLVFLDVRGTSRLHGGAAGLFAAVRRALAPVVPRGLALASNRFTAEVAARSRQHAVTVPPGDEALFLAHLPLDELPLSPALARRLLPLGLRTLGDLASLPVEAVERRYGPEGVALHRLARGEDEAGLLPERPEGAGRVLRELEHPVDRLDRLEPTLEEALAWLLAAVEERGQGALRLRLQLQGEKGPLSGSGWEAVAAAPETRVALWLDLLRLRLSDAPPGAPVEALELSVVEARAVEAHQTRLFGGEPPRDGARRREALARLMEHLGEGAVGTPRLRADHRLEARAAGRGQGGKPRAKSAKRPAKTAGVREGAAPPPRAAEGPPLRLRSPPEELVPVLAGGELVAFRWGRRQLEVAGLSAPRRLEGGWWRQAWARDEHELLTADGARFRICRDLAGKRWLLLGELD